MQSQTMLHLELLTLLLSRLVTSVVDSLSSTLAPKEIRYYTDSQVALFWIQGTNKEWKPFIENRVAEIRSNINPTFWSHCPGKSNPADLPSRGLTALDVSVNQLWQRGPERLQFGVEPCVDLNPVSIPKECMVELRTWAACALTIVSVASRSNVIELINCKGFSTLAKLLRVTAKS